MDSIDPDPFRHADGVRTRAELRRMDADRYVDFRPLGEGGMGVVYLVFDTHLNRYVAFKMARRGSDTDPQSQVEEPVEEAFLARFLQEACVTGGLEHPGVVPVHELGLTWSGAPYYTMRVVRGDRTLEDAIAEVESLEDRLALLEPFLKTCDTVRYAHNQGVIHRDLKPSNIALGEYGETVVLDWGLAKVKAQPDLAESRWHERIEKLRFDMNLNTMTGALGTPGFMAPEALHGELDSVDERSDVYSLGATLYRVLTGRMPHGETGLIALARAIRVAPPPTPHDEDPAIPRGLSQICMKALAIEQDDRYANAGEMAQAVRTWQRERAVALEVASMLAEAENGLEATRALEGDALLGQVDRVLVVTARILELRPDELRAAQIQEEARTRRAAAIESHERETRRRLLRRVAVSALILTAAAAVLVAVLLDAKRREADEARGREQIARTRAEDLSNFMLFELRDKLEPIGRLDLLGSVARRSLAYQRSLPERELTAEDWRDRGLALDSLGDVLSASGDLDFALRSYQDALAIQRKGASDAPDDTAWQRAVAITLERIGEVHVQRGDLDGAQVSGAESLEIKRRLVAQGGGARAAEDLAFGLDELGKLELLRGNLDASRSAYQEALELRERLTKVAPDKAIYRRDMALSLNKLGELFARSGDAAQARAHFRRSVGIGRQLVASDETNTGWKRDLFVSLIHLARVELGEDPAAALARSDEALGIGRVLSASDPTNAAWQSDVSVALEAVGDARVARGEHVAALQNYREGLEIRRRQALADPANVMRQRNLAVSHDQIGKLETARGNPNAALAHLRQSFEITERLAKRDLSNVEWQRDLYVTLASMAGAHEAAGDLVQAARALKNSADRCEALVSRAPHLRRELDILRAEEHKMALLAGLVKPAIPAIPADHLLLGRARYEAKDFEAAAAYFATALEDDATRADLRQGVLYDAACAAALAGSDAWRDRALAWLAEDVRLRRTLIDQIDLELADAEKPLSDEERAELEATRTGLRAHVEHARAQDPDLASLRGTGAFDRLFEGRPR